MRARAGCELAFGSGWELISVYSAMRSATKLISCFCFLWIFLDFVSPYPAYYLAGYFVSTKPLGYSFILFLLLPVPLVSLVGIWIISAIRRKDWLWATGAILGVAALFGLRSIVPAPDNLAIRGLRDRIMRDYTLEDLRRFARDIDKQVHDVSLVDGFVNELPADQAATIKALRVKYPFMYWTKEGQFTFGPSIFENDGVVDMDWGGALPGHWGVSISAHGEKNTPAPAHMPFIPVSDDIYFYVD
jgi:hypothetical protein